MIFTKVNESYDGFEVVEEGWMRTVGLYLVAGGMAGMIIAPPVGLLTGGLTGAGVAVGASGAALLSGLGLLHLDEKLDKNKLSNILNKCPDLLDYFKKFAIDYKKKNPKCFLLIKEVERITTEMDSRGCDVLTGKDDDTFVELEFDNLYTLAFLCDDKLKEIKRICLEVFYIKTHGDESSYYIKYVTIPQPPKSILNKLEIQVKNKMNK